MRNNRQKKEAGRITHSKTTAALLAQAGDKVPEGRALPRACAVLSAEKRSVRTPRDLREESEEIVHGCRFVFKNWQRGSRKEWRYGEQGTQVKPCFSARGTGDSALDARPEPDCGRPRCTRGELPPRPRTLGFGRELLLLRPHRGPGVGGVNGL